MVGAGSVAEAVWVQQGMDASALALEKIVKKVRTDQSGPALPTTTGDVGVVPEYAMLPVLAGSGPAPTLLAGRDHTAQLRYTWFPTAKAVNDPVRAAAVDQLRAALTGPGAAAALDAADLRAPTSADPPSRGRQKVPALTAAPLPVLGGHHVNHVFASWYRDDRQMNVTMVVDVSWSMSTPAPGSQTPLIDLVGHGVTSVGTMLPDQARLGLWTFGSLLDGTRDYRTVVPIAPLTHDHRAGLKSAIADLRAEHTGTGLYDTILAAYRAARDAYTAGRSNQVMVFTDGINEDDPDSITLPELARQLVKAQDPRRPVQLSLVAFGEHPQVEEISKALDRVHAYVESLRTADQVEAMFIHLASGGLHTESPVLTTSRAGVARRSGSVEPDGRRPPWGETAGRRSGSASACIRRARGGSVRMWPPSDGRDHDQMDDAAAHGSGDLDAGWPRRAAGILPGLRSGCPVLPGPPRASARAADEDPSGLRPDGVATVTRPGGRRPAPPRTTTAGGPNSQPDDRRFPGRHEPAGGFFARRCGPASLRGRGRA